MRMQYLAKGVIAFCFLAFPFTASSNDWYAGVSLGKMEDKTRYEKLGGPGFIGTVDNEDSTWKIFGGYRLWDEYVAVEVAYVDLGTTTATGTSGGDPSTGTHELKAFSVGLTGRIPITDPLGVIIRLGFSRNSAKLNTTIDGTTTFKGATDFEFHYGAGLQYEFSDKFAARIEFERFDIDAYNVNLATAGIIYRF